MNNEAVIAFFDRLAPLWDSDMIRPEEVIRQILDGAGVGPGDRVLDVACGTGVLIPDYLGRGAASVTGIDISPEMIRLAREKFRDGRVELIAGDAAVLHYGRRFDRIMIYNAFPHFCDPEGTIAHLAGFLMPGGTLTVAHGMSRERLEAHHRGRALEVSLGLPPQEELVRMFARFLTVTVDISDDRMIQVTGRKE